MKVVSPLANMQVELVSMRRRKHYLILTNDETLTMPVQVSMHPRDVARLLWLFLITPSTWVFALTVPFFWALSKEEETDADGKYPGYKLNNPW